MRQPATLLESSNVALSEDSYMEGVWAVGLTLTRCAVSPYTERIAHPVSHSQHVHKSGHHLLVLLCMHAAVPVQRSVVLKYYTFFLWLGNPSLLPD